MGVCSCVPEVVWVDITQGEVEVPLALIVYKGEVSGRIRRLPSHKSGLRNPALRLNRPCPKRSILFWPQGGGLQSSPLLSSLCLQSSEHFANAVHVLMQGAAKRRRCPWGQRGRQSFGTTGCFGKDLVDSATPTGDCLRSVPDAAYEATFLRPTEEPLSGLGLPGCVECRLSLFG